MDKGTILYVGAFELPDKGASANRVISNGKIFAALGHRVAFLGVDPEAEYFGGIKEAQYPLPEAFTVYEEAYPATTAQWLERVYSIENIKKVVERLSDVKIILLYNTPYVLLKRAKRFFEKRGIKVCYDCTEWNDHADGSFLKRLYKKLDERCIEHRLSGVVNDIMVISRCMENAYSEKKGVNLLRLPPLVDTADEIWHQAPLDDNGKFMFCFAGDASGNKEEIDVVLRAFALVEEKNASLCMIGLTRDEVILRYPELARLCEEDERIAFMGRISHREAVRYVLSCGCCVFIKRTTKRSNAGFSTKFAELATCCVPVVTTDVSDMGEYIGRGVRGFAVDAVDPEAVAGAMREAILRFGDVGRISAVSETFDYRPYIELTKKWLDKVLSSK